MSKFVLTIGDADFSHRRFTDTKLTRLVVGADACQYGLVNRALKQGYLTRIKRGLCGLGRACSQGSPYPYAVALAILPGRDGAF